MKNKQGISKPTAKHLLYTPLLIAAALGLYSAHLPQTNIIFDLGGVLVNLNSLAMVRQVGLFKLFCCTLAMRYKTRDLLYDALDQVDLPPINNCQARDETGRLIPKGMLHWFRGTVSSKEMQLLINRLLEKNPKLYNPAERRFLKLVTHLLFDPQKLACTVSFDKEGLAFVKECKKRGHRVYVLSNWDAESFTYIRSIYSGIFNLFDGVVVSGDVGFVKPDPAIFYYMLEQYQLDPCNTVFIDDQEENISSARTVGIHGIECPKIKGFFFYRHDFQAVRLAFEQWQIEHILSEHEEKKRDVHFLY